MRAVAVIPARFGSTRLPGKPLREVAGRPLIEHVWRRVSSASRLARVVVATDDERIRDAVAAFGGEVVLTAAEHATGSDRIGEVLPRLDESVILNVQGDEPEIETGLLDDLVERLAREPDLAATTAAAPFPEGASPADPDRVKVVLDVRGRALYFSRASIPGRPSATWGGTAGETSPLLHLGVYAYRRWALERFLSLPRGDLECTESLEQLRLLENGLSIGVVKIARAHWGIDTAADLEAFADRMGRRNRGG